MYRYDATAAYTFAEAQFLRAVEADDTAGMDFWSAMAQVAVELELQEMRS